MPPSFCRPAGLLALTLASATIALAGCPRTLELRAPDLSASSSAARTAWTQAEQARATGDVTGARQRLEELVRTFPDDPLGRAAELELARLDRHQGRLVQAR